MDLPAGTVTFLFTDIEGSTVLMRRLGDARYKQVHAAHHELVRTAVRAHNGTEVDAQSESFFISFPTARNAVSAAIAIQRAMAEHPWPDTMTVRVRIGIHTGEPTLALAGYVGIDIHRAARICTAGHGGQVLLSSATQTLVQNNLPPGAIVRDLGKHLLKDLQAREHLFQLVLDGLPSEFPPLRSLNALPNNLPLQLSRFIGRVREMEEIKQSMLGARLVTLTGIAGGGKTRLALQVAADLLESFSDGVWLVEFGAATTPELMPYAVGRALSVPETGGRAIEASLMAYLEGRELLLVLDNCEHLVQSVAHLAHDLLLACPRLRILATSREALHIPGETIYAVPSLALPDSMDTPTLEQLAASEAIQLFVERAALSQPRFKLTDRNAAAIAQIVRRLDGIPLAIELAAARIKSLAVTEIASRLDQKFRILTAGVRTSLPRHRTLEAALDWSYDLLLPQEQTFLRRLSLFRGTFALEAVEIICADVDLRGDEVLDLLSRLMDKSLIVADDDTDFRRRYRLMEIVREYSRGKLQNPTEITALQDRHLEYFLELATIADAELRRRRQQVWVDRLEAEQSNLQGALDWARDQGRANEGLRLAAALAWFWYIRGYWTEGRERLRTAIEQGREAPKAVRARALSGAALLAWRQGDYDSAAGLVEEGSALCRELGDTWGLATSLLVSGVVTRRRDAYAEAEALHEESLALFRRANDMWGIARSMNLLGIAVFYRGDLRRARALVEEGLAMARGNEDAMAIAASLYTLGRISAHEGKAQQAVALLDEALARFRSLRDAEGTASSLHLLGRIEVSQGKLEEASRRLQESQKLLEQIGERWAITSLVETQAEIAERNGRHTEAENLLRDALRRRKAAGYGWDQRGLVECVERIAALETAQGQFERATRLLAAAGRLRQAIVGTLAPPESIKTGNGEADAARLHLGSEAFTRLWAEGEAMTVDRVIAYALGEAA